MKSVLHTIQERIQTIAQADLVDGKLNIYGGDYDIYAEPSLSKDGLTISVHAFGTEQSVLVTWEELLAIKGEWS